MSPATWRNPIGYCGTPRSNIYLRRNCSWLNVVLIQISKLKATRVNEITCGSPSLVQIAWSWGNPCGEVDLKQYAGVGWFDARLWRSSGIFPAAISQSLRVSSTSMDVLAWTGCCLGKQIDIKRPANVIGGRWNSIHFFGHLSKLCVDLVSSTGESFPRWILLAGERVDTSIFCSSAIKSSRALLDTTPSIESIKDIQSENQLIDHVRWPDETLWSIRFTSIADGNEQRTISATVTTDLNTGDEINRFDVQFRVGTHHECDNIDTDQFTCPSIARSR